MLDGMQIDVLVGVLLLGPAGVLAGWVARWLLARMRRGTRVRAPVCAAAVGTVWAVVGAGWGAGLVPVRWVPALLGVGWLGIAAGLVDLRHRRLPDPLTLPALGLAPIALLPLGVAAVERGLLAGLAGIAAYGGLHLVAPGAMGAGDVKLAGSLSTVLGAVSWPALVLAAGLAAAFTAALALVTLAAGARASPLPHGPSMLAATWLVTAAAVGGGGAG